MNSIKIIGIAFVIFCIAQIARATECRVPDFDITDSEDLQRRYLPSTFRLVGSVSEASRSDALGTGALLSRTGYAVTALHVLTPLIEQGTSMQRSARLFAEFYNRADQLIHKSEVRIASSEVIDDLDVILLELENNDFPRFIKPVPVRISLKQNNVRAIGFPYDHNEFTITPLGAVTRYDSSMGVLKGAVKLYHGHSGSVAIDERGFAIGVFSGRTTNVGDDFASADEVLGSYVEIVPFIHRITEFSNKGEDVGAEILEQLANSNTLMDVEYFIELAIANPLAVLFLSEKMLEEPKPEILNKSNVFRFMGAMDDCLREDEYLTKYSTHWASSRQEFSQVSDEIVARVEQAASKGKEKYREFLNTENASAKREAVRNFERMRAYAKLSSSDLPKSITDGFEEFAEMLAVVTLPEDEKTTPASVIYDLVRVAPVRAETWSNAGKFLFNNGDAEAARQAFSIAGVLSSDPAERRIIESRVAVASGAVEGGDAHSNFWDLSAYQGWELATANAFSRVSIVDGKVLGELSDEARGGQAIVGYQFQGQECMIRPVISDSAVEIGTYNPMRQVFEICDEEIDSLHNGRMSNEVKDVLVRRLNQSEALLYVGDYDGTLPGNMIESADAVYRYAPDVLESIWAQDVIKKGLGDMSIPEEERAEVQQNVTRMLEGVMQTGER